MPLRKTDERSCVSKERCLAGHCYEKTFGLVLSLLQAKRFFNRKRYLQVEPYMSHAERIPAFENIYEVVRKTAAGYGTKVFLHAFDKYMDSDRRFLDIIYYSIPIFILFF